MENSKQSDKINNNSDSNYKKHDLDDQILLVCSQCKKQIPLIFLKLKENTIMIEMKCGYCKTTNEMKINEYFSLIKEKEKFISNCTLKEEHSSIESVKYCLNCRKCVCETCFSYHQLYPALSNHIILSRELLVNYTCSLHNEKKMKFLCKECNMAICKKCSETTHKTHSILNVDAIANEINTIDNKAKQFIETVKENNKKSKDTLINLIDAEIIELNKLKQELLLAYADNERKNKIIQEFFILALNNYKVIKDIPSYEVMMNIKNNLMINQEEPQITFPQLKSNFLSLIQYFKTNFIANVKKEYQCLSTLQAHNDTINCMIKMDDGKLATGSYDKTIKIWNPSQLSCEVILHGHTDKIFSLTQLNDGRLASGSRDNTIRIWNGTNWTCLASLSGHSDAVFTLLQIQNGYLLSGSADKSIKVWDVNSMKCLNSLDEHDDIIYSLVELSDKRVASGSKDKAIKLWNMSKFICEQTLQGHNGEVTALLELKDKRLASGSSDQTIIIWDVKQLTQQGILQNHQGMVFSLLQLKNGGLISGTYRDLMIWDLNTMKLTKTLTEHSGNIRGLVEISDGKIASCSDDKTVIIWQI